MSNKKFRAPGSAQSKPVQPAGPNEAQLAHRANMRGVIENQLQDAQTTPEPDPGTSTVSSAAAESKLAQPPSDQTLRTGLEKLPNDYRENGFPVGGERKFKPGVYRTRLGAGANVSDLRERFAGVGSSESPHQPLGDDGAQRANEDAVRFLWQVVSLTSHILESVQVGDLRRVVASDLAMPGDIVLEDGTLSKHPDAFKIGEDGGEMHGRAISKQETPPESETKSKAAKRPRGSSHPLMVLLRLAIQSARLIKQITSGTNPGAHNKMTKLEKEAFDALDQTEKWMKSMANTT